MTEMIARDLQDMHDHPALAILSLILTILIILACLIGCPLSIWTGYLAAGVVL